MADAVATLAEWSGEDVRVADVLDALQDARNNEPRSATRTSVLTLILVARSPESAATAAEAVRELGGRHPARSVSILIVEPRDEADGTRIDAAVRLLGGEAEGRALWSEDLEVRVSGPLADHLDSLIEPFTLPDLPVVVWFVDGLPSMNDPLLGAADVVLVDARVFGDVECFAILDELAGRRPVVDLSWVRLRPWRELLASLFNGAELAPFAAGIVSARVRGKPGPRHLLGGWLRSRLDLRPNAVHLEEAVHVSLQLTAEHRGRRGEFRVMRPGEERVVVASAEVQDGPTSESVVTLPPSTPAWGLADALSNLDRDPVYEAALRAAISH